MITTFRCRSRAPLDSDLFAMPDETRTVVLLATDLMMNSTVGGAASANGLPFQTCSTADAAVDACRDRSDVLLLIDLGTPGLQLSDLSRDLSPEICATAVAYGPHVHLTRLEAARRAGIGSVMSRGQFSIQVSRLIETFAADGTAP